MFHMSKPGRALKRTRAGLPPENRLQATPPQLYPKGFCFYLSSVQADFTWGKKDFAATKVSVKITALNKQTKNLKKLRIVETHFVQNGLQNSSNNVSQSFHHLKKTKKQMRYQSNFSIYPQMLLTRP